MGFEKGNKVGKQFTSEIQPEVNTGRPKGSVSRSTIARKVLGMIGNVPEDVYNQLKLLYPSMERKMTFEEIMTLVQAKKAIIDGDNQSYKLVLDSAFGAPKQEMDMVGEIKITDHKLTIEVIAPKDDED